MGEPSDTSAASVAQFAFDHVAALAEMLRGAGHADMAALLDGMGDLYELALVKGQTHGDLPLIDLRGDAMAYAVSQMNDLAQMMREHGVADAAVLFGVPGKLCRASASLAA